MENSCQVWQEACCKLTCSFMHLAWVNFGWHPLKRPACRLHVRQSSRPACRNRKRWLTRAEVISAEEEESLWKPRYNKYL